MKASEATVHVGAGVVVVRREGSSGSAVANILGSEDKSGIRFIYLDRLVHKPFENELGGYSVSGAISTIISTSTPSPALSDAQA